MSKVKITQEQADLVEQFKRSFKGFGREVLIKTLDGHYEIKKEIKVGDWVLNVYNEDVGIVTELGSSYLKYDDGLSDGFHNFRHATPEEIAKEKQRRFWRSKNRDVWELKEGDTLIPKHDKHTTQIKFVEASDESGVLLVGGGDHFIQEDIKEDLEKNYKIFCFREDRKDIRLGGNYITVYEG